MAEKTNANANANQTAEQFNAQFARQAEVANEVSARSFATLNQMVATSSDMAFDAVLRNWNYSKTIRTESDAAIETAVAQQRQITAQMVEAWQGYTANVQQMMDQAAQTTRKS